MIDLYLLFITSFEIREVASRLSDVAEYSLEKSGMTTKVSFIEFSCVKESVSDKFSVFCPYNVGFKKTQAKETRNKEIIIFHFFSLLYAAILVHSNILLLVIMIVTHKMILISP